MENLEQRVWERVLAQPGEVTEDIRPLILASQELAAAYAQLSKTAGEKTKPLLKALQQEEMGILNSLKGISRLQGREVRLQPLPAAKEQTVRLLEKCFHRSLRARREYLARSAAGEFGEVFRHLADRAGEQCGRIAEVVGMLG